MCPRYRTEHGHLRLFLFVQFSKLLIYHPFPMQSKSRLSPPQLVDISKLGLNSNIKKFSYSFICGKGYSPPSGENSFLSTVCDAHARRLSKMIQAAAKRKWKVKGTQFPCEVWGKAPIVPPYSSTHFFAMRSHAYPCVRSTQRADLAA